MDLTKYTIVQVAMNGQNQMQSTNTLNSNPWPHSEAIEVIQDSISVTCDINIRTLKESIEKWKKASDVLSLLSTYKKYNWPRIDWNP